jgi:hypothetical protein
MEILKTTAGEIAALERKEDDQSLSNRGIQGERGDEVVLTCSSSRSIVEVEKGEKPLSKLCQNQSRKTYFRY